MWELGWLRADTLCQALWFQALCRTCSPWTEGSIAAALHMKRHNEGRVKNDAQAQGVGYVAMCDRLGHALSREGQLSASESETTTKRTAAHTQRNGLHGHLLPMHAQTA